MISLKRIQSCYSIPCIGLQYSGSVARGRRYQHGDCRFEFSPSIVTIYPHHFSVGLGDSTVCCFRLQNVSETLLIEISAGSSFVCFQKVTPKFLVWTLEYALTIGRRRLFVSRILFIRRLRNPRGWVLPSGLGLWSDVVVVLSCRIISNQEQS